MKKPLLIPTLPEAWPYQPRMALPSLHVHRGEVVPGFGGGWTIEGTPPNWHEEGGDLENAVGRGGIRRIGDIVARPYRRGGWMARVNARTYASADRFHRELAVHRALWEAGFPTVEPLGIAWRKCGSGVEGLFFTRFREALSWPLDWSVPLLFDLVTAIQALSAWGLWAPDLNATNVLWGREGIILLDWDRAAWKKGALLPPYYGRLARSLDKLGAPPSIREALGKAFRR